MKKNKEPHVIINIGIPGSGKSTWSKEYIKKHDNYYRVNRDDLRQMLQSTQMMEPKDENILTSIQYNIITKALTNNRNVIVDDTNLNEKYLKQLINHIYKYTSNIECRIFDISVKKAIERDSLREKKVGQAIIEKMYNNYLNILDSFDFSNLKKYTEKPFEYNVKNNDNLTECFIFDIDGTLALMNNKRGPFDWNKVYLDDVNDVVKLQAVSLYERGYKIIIMSGRDDSCKDLTIKWLNDNRIPFDEIYMRKKGDMRKDSYVKTELYSENILGKYFVKGVFDDRLQVVETWYKLGLFTFNVNQGNLEF